MAKSIKLREQAVESICAKGCKYVNQLIVSIDLQAEHCQLQRLNKMDQQWVLVELEAIMQVYENSGSCTVS